MPAQMISLEEAGLEQRADLQEWVLSNPAILGPAVKVVTFEFDGLPTAPGGAGRDRVSVLGLGADGRLVVGELKSSRTPTPRCRPIKYAAMASRMLPESLADHYARFQSRHQTPMSRRRGAGRAAGPRARPLAPDAAAPPHRPAGAWTSRPSRPPAWCGSARWAWTSPSSRSAPSAPTSTGNWAAATCPMISVSQLYPVREVEEFTISPERQLAKEMADSKRRVQDAALVRRLVTTESVADGTIFTLSPRTDLNFDMRSQLEEWLDMDPARRTAHWQNNLQRAAGVGRRQGGVHAGRPGPPRRGAGHRRQRQLRGHAVVARPDRLEHDRAGRSARRRQGRHVPRVLVPLAGQGPRRATRSGRR